MMLKERVFVLKTFKHGDSNLIVHCLNPLGARMHFIARGGAKSQKRFGGGVLEPTHFIEATYKPSRAFDDEPLHTLQEAQIVREFPKLRENYQRLEVALYFLKVVHKISQAGVVDSPDTFNLLGNSLVAAETSLNPAQLRLQFEIKLLQAQGVLSVIPEMAEWLAQPIAHHAQLPMVSKVNHHVHEQILNYIGQI